MVILLKDNGKENWKFSLDENKFKGINNIKDVTAMLYGCISLILLPDISKLDTFKIEDMSLMFSECESLISLPDISNWDTSNIKSMIRMFSGCKSLISFQDISKLKCWIFF